MIRPRGPAAPPRLAEALLARFLPDDGSSRAILGDLREDYLEERARRRKGSADLWYWRQVVSISVRFTNRKRTAHRRTLLVGGLASDLRLALRKLAKCPGFALTTLGTLAVGIGGAVAIFSVLDAALMRALPYPESERLVLGRTTFDGKINPTVSYPDYLDYRDQSNGFQSLSLVRSGQQGFVVSGGDTPVPVTGNWVTVDLFRTLGVEPQLGRSFSADEAAPGSDWVVMISHGFWQRFYGGSPEALGRTLVMEGFRHTVVGIMPPGFHFRYDADVWLPIRDGDMDTRGRTSHSWLIVARLRAGISLDGAQTGIDVVSDRLTRSYPDSHEGKALLLTPLGQALAEGYRPSLLVLMGATGLLLVIACGNVASLLLARASTRRGELSVRAALGASRIRLVLQHLVESFLTAAMAGALGSGLALGLQRLLLTTMPLDLLGVREIGLSRPMLGFAVAVSAGTAVIFGIGPALTASRANPAVDLRSGGRAPGGGRSGRVRAGMVVLQVALTVVLLSASGLLVRSFVGFRSVDVGFETENLLTAVVRLPEPEYDAAEARAGFFRGMAEDVEALAGVRSASFINMVPIRHRYMNWAIWDPENAPGNNEARPSAYSRTVLPGYFETMGIPMLRGRDHDYADVDSPRALLVISESLAQTLFSGQNPIGRRVSVFNAVADPMPFEVVGVVGDIRMTSLDREPFPQMYFGYTRWPGMAMNLVVRTTSEAGSLVPAVRNAVRERDPDVLVTSAATMDAIVADSWSGNRLLGYTVTLFAVFALFLALTGVYGVLAFQVARRTHEIGVRMALGASRGAVMGTVLRRGLVLVASGLGIGLPIALSAAGVLRSQLFGVEPTDAWTYAAVASSFLVMGAFACFIPARRALAIDPAGALQAE